MGKRSPATDRLRVTDRGPLPTQWKAPAVPHGGNPEERAGRSRTVWASTCLKRQENRRVGASHSHPPSSAPAFRCPFKCKRTETSGTNAAASDGAIAHTWRMASKGVLAREHQDVQTDWHEQNVPWGHRTQRKGTM